MFLLEKINNFRIKLIIGLVIPIIIILGFDFYIFTQVSQFETLLNTPPFTQDKIASLEKGGQGFSQVSFLFLSLVIIFNLGIAIILVVNLTFALRIILEGIRRIEGGDLSYRIPLHSDDEFGNIAKFLNTATAKVEITQKSIEQKVRERTQQLAIANDQLTTDKITISAERNKLAVIIGGITDAVIVVDLNRNIIIFNHAAQYLTGYIRDEVMGRRIDDVIQFYDKETKVSPEDYCPIHHDTFEGIIYSKSALKMVGKKGAYVSLITGKITEGEQNNLGCILTVHDISKEKELETIKFDFVSMVAHELRTPITTIQGYLSVFRSENLTKFDNEQNLFLDKINTATNQLGKLTEDILNASNIERGIFQVSTQPTNWANLLHQIILNFESKASEKHIKLTLNEPSSHLPLVMADALKITEVLNNLISNAIKYTSSGGSIDVSTEIKNNFVITHIKDTGQGIPSEAIPHLFTKFFRAWGKLEMSSSGTGLGLYITKNIVEAHHGTIWVESIPNKGSTFSFSLPIQKTA